MLDKLALIRTNIQNSLYIPGKNEDLTKLSAVMDYEISNSSQILKSIHFSDFEPLSSSPTNSKLSENLNKENSMKCIAHGYLTQYHHGKIKSLCFLYSLISIFIFDFILILSLLLYLISSIYYFFL